VNVLFLKADAEKETGLSATSSAWLCEVPARALSAAGVEARVRSAFQVHREHPIVRWADVIIIERLGFAVRRDMIESWRDQGKRVFLRFDDAYVHMPHWSPSWQVTWCQYLQGQPALTAFKNQIRLFDGYSTPSRLLTNDYSNFGKGTFIPNRPDLLTFPQPKLPTDMPSNVLNVVWGGSIPHRQSWTDSGAAEAINRYFSVCTKGFRLHLLGARGWYPDVFDRVRYVTYPWAPIPLYRERLRQIADVGLAPLAGPYDARRSWIKVLVYSLLGIPWIASDMPPYEGCKGGLLVENTFDGWFAALAAIRDPDLRRRLRQEGMDWAWGQGIRDHVQEWLDWIGE